jgi:hypothetical protein
MKKWLEYSISKLFSNRKCHGFDPWLVDQRRGGQSTGPPWTHSGADRGHCGALTGAWTPAAPVHQSSPVGVQQREGNAGNPVGGSPRHGQRCGGQATVRKQPQGGRSATWEHRLRERGRVSWEGAVKSGVVLTFYRGRGGRAPGRGIQERPTAGIKGRGGNSECKSQLWPGLRRDNGRP